MECTNQTDEHCWILRLRLFRTSARHYVEVEFLRRETTNACHAAAFQAKFQLGFGSCGSDHKVIALGNLIALIARDFLIAVELKPVFDTARHVIDCDRRNLTDCRFAERYLHRTLRL